jgi:hypothetical protein
MTENTAFFENLSEHLHRTRKRVSRISRSRFCGLLEAVRNGDFCLMNTAIGTQFTNVLLAGRARMSLKNYLSFVLLIAFWSIFLLI